MPLSNSSRNALSQLLATCAKNLLLFNSGLALGFVIHLIGALHETTEDVSMDSEQISWLSSLGYFTHPLGSVWSGVVVQALGRKRAMLLICAPFAAAWLLYHFATTPSCVFGAVALSGVAMGLTEAPVKTYAAEICQPKYRGTFTSLSGIFFRTGVLIQFFMLVYLHWKNVALINVGWAIFGFLCFLQIPESPQWLVARGRIKDAEQSLCWLRGWTEPENVQEELQNLIRYNKDRRGLTELQELRVVKSMQGSSNVTYVPDTNHEDLSMRERFIRFGKDMMAPETRRPFLFILGFFVVEHMAGGIAVTFYVMKVLPWFNLPVKSEWILVMVNILALTMLCILTSIVHRVGKRRVALVSCAGSCVLFFLLGLYFLSSFQSPWVGFAALFAQFFFLYMGLFDLPWIILCEIFPYKTRGIASGIVASIEHVVAFSTMKTFLSLVDYLGMKNIWWLYAACGVVGFAYLFVLLPETEGRSLEDIEKMYGRKMIPTAPEKSLLRKHKLATSSHMTCLL